MLPAVWVRLKTNSLLFSKVYNIQGLYELAQDFHKHHKDGAEKLHLHCSTE